MPTAPPPGFEKIKPALNEFESQLKQVHHANTSRIAAKKDEKLWEILKINNERSRYIFNLFYKRKAISRELYEWLLKNRLADRQLIAKWKKKGYEKLCCLKCIQRRETNHGNVCICRIPRAHLLEKDSNTFRQCNNCGCHGCSSTD
ncbi:hypothetical protein ZYGM_004723 [Zygosaccharomyces mellis]|uniref:Component of the SF3b subcomplex of the U2 snRNP n=1 Tax=Zygosaccharomyces mellis TaxID=42258 RepID=A0A4C2E199_9SACH|nr:hypothetical protein ZYGM_004723 [Zygosaccharomyces mellis]